MEKSLIGACIALIQAKGPEDLGIIVKEVVESGIKKYVIKFNKNDYRTLERDKFIRFTDLS